MTRAQIEEMLAGQDPKQVMALMQSLAPDEDTDNDSLWERCSKDMWFWVTHYAKAINMHVEENVPEGKERSVASIDVYPPYPHIRIVVNELRLPRNVLIEKSRDMMGTWSIAAIFLHDILFCPTSTALMASRAFADVDDGGPDSTPDSLLGRVRFIYEQLPDWMKHRAPLRFKKALIRNEDTDAFIAGVKAIRHTGRGGKYRRVFADEFGHWQYGAANLASLRYACQNGLILLSTPPREGAHHEFGRLATDPELRHFKKVSLHWTMHPLRDRDWYVRASADLDPEDIARELDISYHGAVSGRVYPMFDPDIHRLEEIPYNPELPLFLTFDHGLNEETCLFVQVDAVGRVYVIDEYQGGRNTDIDNVTPWDHAETLVAILQDEPYSFVIGPDGEIKGLAGAYGDPTGQRMNMPLRQQKRDDSKLTSYHAVYAQYGIVIQSKFTKQIDGIQIVRDHLGGNPPKLFIAKKCDVTWDSMIHHRRKPIADPLATGYRYTDSVVEDWTKHAMDALRYFFINRTTLAGHRMDRKKKYRQVWSRSATGACYPQLELIR